MRNRLVLAIAALGLVASACGQDAGLSGEVVNLRYAFQPGDSLVYNTDLQVEMEMTGTGDFGIPGGLDMTMEMAMEARSTYDIAEGPDPETVRLSVGTTILDGSGTIEMLGMTQDIPFSEIMGEAAALDVEMVINAQGEIVDVLVGGQALPPGLLENLGGFGGANPMSQLDPTQLLGPVLPDGPIEVGATWTTETTEELLGITTTNREHHRRHPGGRRPRHLPNRDRLHHRSLRIHLCGSHGH